MIFSYERSGQFVRNGKIAQFGQNGLVVNYKLRFHGIKHDTVNLRVNLEVNLEVSLEVNLEVDLEANLESWPTKSVILTRVFKQKWQNTTPTRIFI